MTEYTAINGIMATMYRFQNAESLQLTPRISLDSSISRWLRSKSRL